MLHQRGSPPENRRAPPLRATKHAPKRRAQGIRTRVLTLDMALEEEHPAELNALGHHDLRIEILDFCLLLRLDQSPFEFAALALPEPDGAVHATRSLPFLQGFFAVADLQSPGPLAEAGEFVGFGGQEVCCAGGVLLVRGDDGDGAGGDGLLDASSLGLGLLRGAGGTGADE